MALYRYTGTSWKKIKNVYRKTDPASYPNLAASNFTDSSKEWRRHSAFYYRKGNGTWVRVHTKTSTGVVFTTGPAIHTYGGASNPYGPNDGITVSSPRKLNAVLYGKDGIWTPRNEISVSRSFMASDIPDGSVRFTIDSNDIFDLSTASSTIKSQADESYLYYKISVTNYGDTVTASAGPIFLIKDYPIFTSFTTGTTDPTVGNTLTAVYNLENYYYNSIERSNSVIEWWRSTTTDPQGTLIKSTLVSNTNITTNNSTSLQGTDTYTLTNADAGYYVVAKIKVVNSWTRYYNDTNYYASDPTTGTVTAPISISNVRVEDTRDNSAVDNYFGLPTATSLRFRSTISGVNSSTTYRVRYRYYNWQTSAITSWTTYTANSTGVGSISSVSISNGTATISDSFAIDSGTYNGSTYTDAYVTNAARWGIEMEVAAIRNGITTTNNLIYDIHAASNPTLTSNVTGGSPPLTVTFSGSISGYPSGYKAYPKSYTINFGDGSTPYTGTFSYNTPNPTFSGISHTYSSAGTYTASITTTPYYTTTYANPIITLGAPTSLTATSNRKDGVYLQWTNTGANYYEIYWQSSSGTGPINQSTFADFGSDNSITTNSYLDTTIAEGATRYYRVRARNEITSSGSNASDWYPGPSLSGISGTRLVSKPSTPTWVSSSSNSTAYISLSWNAATDAATYQLYFNSNNTAPTNGQTYADYKDLTSTSFTTPYAFAYNTTFYWWVRGVSSGGTLGDWSLVRSVTTPRQTYTVYWNGNSGTVSIPSSTTDSSGYVTTPTPTRSGYTFLGWYNTTAGDYTYGPIPANYYWLVPENNLTMSARWSLTLPGIPTSLSATTTRTDGVNLTFSGSTNATSYDLFWNTSISAYPAPTATPDFSGVSSPYLDTTISSGGTRYYWVRGKNSGGVSDWYPYQTNGITGTRVAPISNATAPTSVSASGGNGSATVSWSGATNAVKYRIWWSTSSTGNGVDPASSYDAETTSSPYTFSGLSNGTTYYFWVSASNTNNVWTAYSSSPRGSATPSAPSVPAPVLSSISGNNSLSLGGTFSWSYTNSPTGYSIFCQGPTGTVFTTNNAYTYTGTSFRPGYDGTGWQGAGNYTIYVSATNSGGSSVVSSQTTFMN